MDYEVMRVCAHGRQLEVHIRNAGRVRGTVTVKQEQDGVRHRTRLVARLAPLGGFVTIPPLYDAVLLQTRGEHWVLTGLELIASQPLGHEVSVAQTWIIEPVVVQDLIDIEIKWTNAVRDANALREELAALKAWFSTGIDRKASS